MRCPLYPIDPAEVSTINTFSRTNPGSRSRRFSRLRTNNPAPTSSNNESATCTITNALRRSRRANRCEKSLFKADTTSGRVALRAGTMPQINPVSRETAKENPSNRASGVRCRSSGNVPVGSRLNSTRTLQYAKTRPASPPITARITASVTNCEMRRQRPAPIATRIAISFRRDTARASSRLATFAHAISKTNPTTAPSTASGFENRFRRYE